MTQSSRNHTKLDGQKLSSFDELQSSRVQLVEICYFIQHEYLQSIFPRVLF